MPNIDFYAAGRDFTEVLDYVFEKSECRVFESYSPYGKSIAEFRSAVDLSERYPIGTCTGTAHSVLLQLVPPSGFNQFKIRRMSLDPKACKGHTFRYAIEGWGLIQLYLGGTGPAGLVHSHSAHNSEARATKWVGARPNAGSPEFWDWREITSISSALNRFVRNKLSVYKLGSRPVLRNAAAAFAAGVDPVSAGDKSLLATMRALGSNGADSDISVSEDDC
jgi:hypothetical protein